MKPDVVRTPPHPSFITAIMPEISVIMPAYNTAKYIAEAIDSVLAQTFTDWELIVINDGSPDDSRAIATGYAARDTRITVLDQKNSGVAVARNHGISAARGKYIFPLDSDDLIAPDCLATLLHVLKTTGCAVACPDGRYFGLQEGPLNLPKISRRNMYGAKNGVHNSSLYEKKHWANYGGYDASLVHGYEDYEFWLNFMDDGQKMVRVPGELFFYRQKPTEESRNEHGKKNGKTLLETIAIKHPRMETYKKIDKLRAKREFFYRDRTNIETGHRRIDIFKKPVYKNERFSRISKFAGTGAHPLRRPRISIVTVCLNEPRLERTCESIVSQTFQYFEWIVIDGGSVNPETRATLEKYRGRMARFVSEKDNGIYEAMNKGIALASGRWINFMNGGDKFSSPDALEKMARELNADKADIVYGMIRFDGDGKLKIDRLRIPDDDIDRWFWLTATPPHPAMFYKSELFSKYGGFSTEFRIVSDWVRNLTFWRKGARYKFAEIMVADFDNSGVSSVGSPLHWTENRRVKMEYFSEFVPGCKFKRSLYRMLHTVSIGDRLRRRLKRRYETYEIIAAMT